MIRERDERSMTDDSTSEATGEELLTWRRLLTETAHLIGESAPARWLCETASGLAGDQFLSELDEPATERMVAHLDAMVTRYRNGEPLAYVLGHWSFRRIDVMVDRRVLIPRPETEIVAGRAIEVARNISETRRILDLGTGSGVIGLSVAAELPFEGTEVWLTDVSEDSLEVARANAAGLGRQAVNIRVSQGDWFTAIPEDLSESFDVIVSNPPYIAQGDPQVEPSVLAWEPDTALFSGVDGLHDLRLIVDQSLRWLRPGGWLIVEIGSDQGATVEEFFHGAGYDDVRVGQDLAGRDRYVEGRRTVQ